MRSFTAGAPRPTRLALFLCVAATAGCASSASTTDGSAPSTGPLATAATATAPPIEDAAAAPSTSSAPAMVAGELPEGWEQGPSIHPWRLAPVSEAATQAWVDAIDIERYQVWGTSYAHPEHDPRRLGVALDELDLVYDFDSEQLRAIEERLAGVDRHVALRALFDAVTEGAATPHEQHVAVVQFLQRAIMHPGWIQPMYPDGVTVYDPLVLLELGQGRCGHSNRLAADLLAAGGYPTREVQFSAHVAAEVYYDDDWHALEVDLLSGGVVPLDPDGTIPSFRELSENPERFDVLNFMPEPNVGYPRPSDTPWPQGADPIARFPYPTYYLFSSQAGTAPAYHYKRATPEQEANSRLFGWEHLEIVPDPDRTLYDVGPTHYVFDRAPLAADRDGSSVTLTFAPADDVVERVVWVSTQSRGWSVLADPIDMVSGQVAHEWSPDMYDDAFAPIPADVGTWTATGDQLTLRLPDVAEDDPVYVSYIARDAYAVEIGKFNLTPSVEFRLDP